VLAPGEALKVFMDEVIGISFNGIIKTKNGKAIAVSMPSKADADYINQTHELLNPPPKKKNHAEHTFQHPGNPNVNIMAQTMTYNQVVLAHQTQTQTSESNAKTKSNHDEQPYGNT
jgi:hypothetical protein